MNYKNVYLGGSIRWCNLIVRRNRLIFRLVFSEIGQKFSQNF